MFVVGGNDLGSRLQEEVSYILASSHALRAYNEAFLKKFYFSGPIQYFVTNKNLCFYLIYIIFILRI